MIEKIRNNTPRENWEDYARQTLGRDPRPLLIRAVSFVEKREKALDLGSGALNGSRFLIEQGFDDVVAVDKYSVPSDIPLPQEHFKYVISALEDFDFPADTYNLVNAEYSLPFVSPDVFDRVLSAIDMSLKQKGILTGQLFGDRDQWAAKKDMTFHTKGQAVKLFENFNIVEFSERDEDGATADGKLKHWHTFHFIVRK